MKLGDGCNTAEHCAGICFLREYGQWVAGCGIGEEIDPSSFFVGLQAKVQRLDENEEHQQEMLTGAKPPQRRKSSARATTPIAECAHFHPPIAATCFTVWLMESAQLALYSTSQSGKTEDNPVPAGQSLL